MFKRLAVVVALIFAVGGVASTTADAVPPTPAPPGARAFLLTSAAATTTTAAGARGVELLFYGSFTLCSTDIFITLPVGASADQPLLHLMGESMSCDYAFDEHSAPGVLHFTRTRGDQVPSGKYIFRGLMQLRGIVNPPVAGAANEYQINDIPSLPTSRVAALATTAPQAVAAFTISASDTTAGAGNVGYDIVVTPSSSGHLGAGSRIVIQLPAGAVIGQPQATAVNLPVYPNESVPPPTELTLIGSGGSTATYVTSVEDMRVGRRYLIHLDGVTNPSAAGQLQALLWTSSDSVPQVAPLTITPGASSPTAIGGATLALSTSRRWAPKVSYSVTATLSPRGALAAGEGRIFITVPAETYVPWDVLPQVFDTVTGRRATRLTLVGQSGSTFEYRVQRPLAAGVTYRFDFNKFANNGAKSEQAFTIWTSADTTPVSLPYTLTKRSG